MTTALQTNISMVLDRSGSMSSCRSSTISAVNKYLAEARSSEDLKEADFQLMIFDDTSIDTIRKGRMGNVADITAADFVPRGGTPLLDAIGRGIDGLNGRLLVQNTEKAILVIVTDGEENQSRKHTYESIKALIEDRQEKGWLILFLGAGLSSAQQGTRMGVRSANVANIGLDEASLDSSMSFMAASNARYCMAVDMSDARAYAASQKMTRSVRMSMGDASGGAGIVDDEDEADHLSDGIDAGDVNNLKPTRSAQPSGAKPDDAWHKGSGDIWGR